MKSCRDSSYANVLFYECECSLRRLQTDYIDFYFVHWPDYEIPLEETMTALNKLKADGKIRHIGVSNFNKDQILESEQYAQIDVIQPPYSMVSRRDEDLMKWCVGRGIDTLARQPGRRHPHGHLPHAAGIPSGDPRNGFIPSLRSPTSPRVMKVLEVMDGISAEIGKPLPQITLNWSTQKRFVSTALCGVRNPQGSGGKLRDIHLAAQRCTYGRHRQAIAENLDFDGSAPLK